MIYKRKNNDKRTQYKHIFHSLTQRKQIHDMKEKEEKKTKKKKTFRLPKDQQ